MSIDYSITRSRYQLWKDATGAKDPHALWTFEAWQPMTANLTRSWRAQALANPAFLSEGHDEQDLGMHLDRFRLGLAYGGPDTEVIILSGSRERTRNYAARIEFERRSARSPSAGRGSAPQT